MKRKYTNVRVSTDVYCNSLGQYTFLVRCQDAKRGYKLEYSPGFGLICWGKREMGGPLAIEFPKYLYDEIERQIYVAYNENRLTIYEYDRDRNKRRKDYRYHDDELLAANLQSLAQVKA